MVGVDKASWGSQGLKEEVLSGLWRKEGYAGKRTEASVNVENSQIWRWRGGPRAHMLHQCIWFLF